MAQHDARERILEAAATLFMEHGFAATSVRMIGDLAGVGQSSLYHHAGSKGQILVDLHQSFNEVLLADLQSVAAGDASTEEKVRAIVGVVFSTVERHQARVTVYLRESHALPLDQVSRANATRDQVDAVLDQILEHGIKSGELRADLNIRLTRLAIFGMCNWSYQWLRPGGAFTSEQIADRFADLVLNGIAAR
jgi:AcrR family transcriptional regulator